MANRTFTQNNVDLPGDMTTYVSPSGTIIDQLKAEFSGEWAPGKAADQSSAGTYGYDKRGSLNTQFAGRQAQLHAYMCDKIDKYIQFPGRKAQKTARQCECPAGSDPTSLACILQRDLKAQKIEGEFLRENVRDLASEEVYPDGSGSIEGTVSSSAESSVTSKNIDELVGNGVAGYIYDNSDAPYTGNTSGSNGESDWTENVKRIWSSVAGYKNQIDATTEKMTGSVDSGANSALGGNFSSSMVSKSLYGK